MCWLHPKLDSLFRLIYNTPPQAASATPPLHHSPLLLLAHFLLNCLICLAFQGTCILDPRVTGSLGKEGEPHSTTSAKRTHSREGTGTKSFQGLVNSYIRRRGSCGEGCISLGQECAHALSFCPNSTAVKESLFKNFFPPPLETHTHTYTHTHTHTQSHTG